MKKVIEKIKLKNLKRFREFSVICNDSINILVGDNEAGKSSILLAIDLVLSGSRSKVESYGLDNLFNASVIEEFLASDKKYEDLPILSIELYFNDQNNKNLDGKFNSEDTPSHGLILICEPRDDLSSEIQEILKQSGTNFPFEYYSIQFKTFSGESYTSYRSFLRHLLLDNTQINNEYATKSYIKKLYHSNVLGESEKNKHANEYRKLKENFKESALTELNARINDYSFAVRNNSKANLETDLTIKEGNIDIENRGKGRQCFIRTDFALQKNPNELDIILLEEPENHLSHTNMKKLIERIHQSQNKQLFIATHSNLVSARLDLRKLILLNSTSQEPLLLDALPESTSKFFMKAPDNNILEFILSKKVILVEGDAEFILMENFYKKTTSENLNDSDIHIISVGGTSFKRYLDIASILDIKTAVIRDNDGNHEENCIKRYSAYQKPHIKVFADPDNSTPTFECAVYRDNEKICEELFNEGRKSLTTLNFMLSQKANCAFELLDKKANELTTPKYIQEAIQWIKE